MFEFPQFPPELNRMIEGYILQIYKKQHMQKYQGSLDCINFLNSQDIKLVQDQANVSWKMALNSLVENNGDIVDAIISLC